MNLGRPSSQTVKENTETPAVIALGRSIANNTPSFAKSENTVRKDCFKITYFIYDPGAVGVAANLKQIIYTAHEGIELVSATEVHKTANTVATTAGLGIYIEKLTPGTAPGSGSNMLVEPFKQDSTANTPITKRGKNFVLTPTADGTATTVLSPGDSVGFGITANRDTVIGIQLTLVFKHTGRGDYRVV